MSRSRVTRAVAVTATAVMLALATLSTGSVLAANTRDLYIGAGPVPQNDGTLLPSPVSAGGSTVFSVVVKNVDNQTLTGATLSLGVFPAHTFPTGVTVNTVYGPNASACTWTTGGPSIVCAYGNLAAGAARSIIVVLDVAATFPGGLLNVDATAKVNEQINDNGRNTDTFSASTRDFAVAPFSPDGFATFVPPGIARHLATSAVGGSNTQSTELTIPATADGSLVDALEAAFAGCSGNLDCFGQGSFAHVNGGALVSPYLEWKITWIQAGLHPNKAGVLHFFGDTPSAALEIISTSSKDSCARKAAPCMVSFTYDGLTAVAIIRTLRNGVAKGFG